MKVFIERQNKNLSIKFKGRVKDLLNALGILPEECIVVRAGELLTEDDQVYDKDNIRILSVVSGG